MSEPSAATLTAPAARLDEARERWVALGLTVVVLATLTLVKPLGAMPIIGAVGYTVAAALQLYLPLWRADRLRVPIATFGLHLATWRRDLELVLILCAVTFPPYALAHHFYMTSMHEAVRHLGFVELARHIPVRVLAPHGPVGLAGWLAAGGWLAQAVATHTLGVALPEEAFYRGYLQPRLESRWPPRLRVLGVPLGKGALFAAFLFACGHFLGEWNPLRFGPLVPALAFAWLRNSTGSVAGAVAYHAACNVYGQILFGLYQPL